MLLRLGPRSIFKIFQDSMNGIMANDVEEIERKIYVNHPSLKA